MEGALQEANQEGAARLAPMAAALQRLDEGLEADRAQAAEVAGDYTPLQLQVGSKSPLSPLLVQLLWDPFSTPSGTDWPV